MPSLTDVLTVVCRLPIDMNRGNVNAIELLRRSGYLSVRSEVTVDHLSDCLARDPALVDAWIQWSEDNRSTPAWYISRLGLREFEVAYLDRRGRSSQHLRFDDKLRACAVYASHDLEQLAERAELRSSPLALIRSLLRQRRSR